MQACGDGILLVVIQAEEGREADAAHAAEDSPFLGVEAVWEYALMAGQVQRFVLVGVIGFLENRDVVSAAFVQVGVFIGIDRVDFHTDDAEVLAGDFDGVADVVHIGHMAAFTGEHEHLFQAGLGDVGAFLVELFVVQAGPDDFVVAVEAAVDAVIFAVVGEVDRREQVHCIAEVAARHAVGLLGNLFQEGQGGRGQEGHEVVRFQVLLGQGRLDVAGRVVFVVEGVMIEQDLVEHIRVEDFHARQVFHVVNAFFFHSHFPLNLLKIL